MKLGSTYEDYLEYGDRYKFYYNKDEKTLICTILYKGKTIRGIAKCDPDDEFNIDTGKKLAYLRCRQKLLVKKVKHSSKVEDDATAALEKAKVNMQKASKFYADATSQLYDITNSLRELEIKLNQGG